MTRNEVPGLARALTAWTRQQAWVDRHVINDVPCIRVYNKNGAINALVRGDDWAKIVPYIKDGTLSISVLPVAEPGYSDPQTTYDVSTIDVNDRELYQRIVTLLNTLFPIEFPTSDI